MTSALHDDAIAVLTAWAAPDPEQDRLRRTYLGLLSAEPAAMTRDCHPDHLTASALIVSTDRREVLLTHHAKVGLWLQTGGHCEPGDRTIGGAALREATEESGLADLRLDPEPVRLSRHAVPFCGPVQPAHHADVQFVVTAEAGAEPTVSEESLDVAWWPVDALPEATDDEVRALVSAALSRLRGGSGLSRLGGTAS